MKQEYIKPLILVQPITGDKLMAALSYGGDDGGSGETDAKQQFFYDEDNDDEQYTTHYSAWDE